MNDLLQANEEPQSCFMIEERKMNVLVHLLIKSIKLLGQTPLDMQCKERMNPGPLKEKNFPQAIQLAGMNF